MTIHATKADVDATRKALEDALTDLADRAESWRNDLDNLLHGEVLRMDYGHVQDRAEEYVQTLKAWAAGPGGGDRG